MEKILIVEDDPAHLLALEDNLSFAGYEVSTARSGRQALEILKQDKFDLIILDMDMPVMNGAQGLEKLKEMKDFKIPILILSADKEEESKATGISLGASYYMTKPFKPPEVVARIEEIIKERTKTDT